MSNISAKMVKELRDRTGAGMMECKKALTNSSGDMEKAVEEMRKAGQAKADKKSSRVAAEGVITLSISEDNKFANIIEINCETDFVAKDESFLEFVKKISDISLQNFDGNIENFLNSQHPSGKTVEEVRLELVSKVGENVKIRRIQKIDANNSYIGYYMHGSKIGVAVLLKNENTDLAKDICMHIAAMKPIALNASDISQKDLNKEREIYLAQAKESGKPEDIIKKMVDGKIKKYISEVTLIDQKFVKDSEVTVGKLLEKNNNEILSFYRLEVGEGVEKKDENFADEVMAQIKK